MVVEGASGRSMRSDAELALSRVGLTLGSSMKVEVRARERTDGQETTFLLIDAMAAYLEAVRNTKRSIETYRSYRHALKKFGEWLFAHYPEARCSDLTHELADQFLHYLRQEHRTPKGDPLQETSVRYYLVILKALSAWGARGKRFWESPPLADYQVPTAAEKEIVPLTSQEIRQLLEACGPASTFMGRRLRAILLVALDTGMRKGELCRLTLEMIDLDTGRIRLPAAITKTRCPRSVYLQRASLDAVRLWHVARNALPGASGASGDTGPLFCQLSGASITREAMHELAVRLSQRSGIARFHWHLIRHTAGTESLRNGADSLDVQEMLGHTTSMMTKRYLHLTDDDRKERHARYSPVQALLERSEPRENRFKRRSAEP